MAYLKCPRVLHYCSCLQCNSQLFLKIQDNYSLISSQQNLFQFYKWERNVIIFRIIEWIGKFPVKPALQLNFFLNLWWLNNQQSQSPLTIFWVWSTEPSQYNFSGGFLSTLCNKDIIQSTKMFVKFLCTYDKNYNILDCCNISDFQKQSIWFLPSTFNVIDVTYLIFHYALFNQ